MTTDEKYRAIRNRLYKVIPETTDVDANELARLLVELTTPGVELGAAEAAATDKGQVVQTPMGPMRIWRDDFRWMVEPAKTRGQEVAESLLRIGDWTRRGDGVKAALLQFHGSPGAHFQLDPPTGAEDALAYAKQTVAALIDAERADAAKAEREACAREPANAMRDYWDSAVAPPYEVQSLVTQIEKNIRARK